MCKSIADDCINIEFYTSTLKEPDLRSKMLNEGFLNAKTQFVGFLDYDDLLMPHAYDFLIKRLKETNKAVAFGRVFSTEYDTTNGILRKRRKDFEYNCSYEEFINRNHAPLHSFLIDTHKIEKEKIVYHEYHPYMEDYFLMLQIINELNTDWESLLINCYLGDYTHPTNRESTLGINDTDKKMLLLNEDLYMRCEGYINQLRSKIGSKSCMP